jgi:glycine/D-amino acid oxidase-like deaminating enzyme
MERIRILDPHPDRAQVEETLSRARDLLPALAASRVTSSWASYIDSTPDGLPAIGATGILGLILAAGFSGHGFGTGPGAGRLVADLTTGATASLDLTAYSPARLARSSRGRVAEF